nr:RNA polymerase sigma factor SigJ [Kibdelosporangium sp. MJ126-NF4]CEL22889.1 putative RNA polymerase sigma factor [Kibdelosporangium sp. MJ126-NF4]CTQ90029.1 putative RNA polymerase sigma factor [Kibdelosporangium sp. MJ126-NF4]
MSDEAELAEAYTQARPRLMRVAYAVTGSLAEAEDVVSDCWLRLVTANETEPVQDVESWATVVVARRALDTLRSARVRRETYVGSWLPEPWVQVPDHADRVTLDEQVSFALMVVMERLSPAERVAWVLHDLFGVEFPEVARIVGRTSAAVRQLAARARKHVTDGTPRVHVDHATHEAVVHAFQRAATQGDLPALMSVLDPDVTLTSDGGGKVPAIRRPMHGAEQVARFMVIGMGMVAEAGHEPRIMLVNGRPGLVITGAGRYDSIISLTVEDGMVSRVDVVRAPDKLALTQRLRASPSP